MNEKKFHQDEFAMLLGNQMNARMEEGGQVLSTQLARFSKLLLISPIFGLISCLKTVDPVSPVSPVSPLSPVSPVSPVSHSASSSFRSLF